MTTAQEEFDELFRDKEHRTRHPEDDEDESEGLSSTPRSEADRSLRGRRYDTRDSDYEDEEPEKMTRARNYIPARRSEANTGPKGVIADAQAFEQAKRAHRYSYLRNEKPMNGTSSYNNRPTTFYDDEKSSDDEEDRFMQRWREKRLKELQRADRQVASRSRSRSGGKRIFGTLVPVDGHGYLDAIEKVALDIVVVVFIYDDTSEISTMVEDCLRTLARKHATTRFVKLHYEDAEMEVAGVPAILAYRGGDKFAGLIPVVDELPDDADLDERTLEDVMKRHHILF